MYVVFVASVVMLVGVWYYSFVLTVSFEEKQYEKEKSKSITRLTKTEVLIDLLFLESEKDLLFLADLISNDLQNNVPLEKTSEKLFFFSSSYLEYFQTRLLDSLGKEIIRVDNIGEGSYYVPEDKLQNKSRRYYFKKTKVLDKGEVFVSFLDLNIENKKIEIPHRPTIRFFTPIYIGEKFHGIVGLNLNAKEWLYQIEDKGVTLLNSKNEVYCGGSEELYSESKINYNDNPFILHKELIFKGLIHWKIITKVDASVYQKPVIRHKKSVYIIASTITFVHISLFILISYVLIKRKKYNDKVRLINIELIKEIEQRKKTESELVHSNEELKIYLEERSLLLKEIHHRVKNNLQVVSSLLSLQSRNLKNDEIKEIFQYSTNRIRAIASVHEGLYKSKSLSRINFEQYLEDLIRYLSNTYEVDRERTKINVDASDVFLNIDTAVPLSIIVNEILTLLIRFSKTENGPVNISIEIHDQKEGDFLHIFGKGYNRDECSKFEEKSSFELKLIEALVHQLDGALEVELSDSIIDFKAEFDELIYRGHP